jgi:trk system potassium uptake protein TrkA
VNILIVGAGRLGQQAMHLLAATGHTVTIVDRDRSRLSRLAGELPHTSVHGDACEPQVLERAGALTADLLLASTAEDEDNLVVALLAKRQFGVRRVLARINEPENTWLFDGRWGVDVALSGSPLVSLIEEATGAADTIGLLRLAAAGVTLLETHLSDRSAAAGRTIAQATLPPNTVVAAVIRDRQPTVPDPGYRLQPGDTLLVVTQNATEQDIRHAFQ